MFRKTKIETSIQNLKVSFVPEEIVKVFSDITVKVEITDDEMKKLEDLIRVYKHAWPKMKIIVSSPTQGTMEGTNFAVHYNEVLLG